MEIKITEIKILKSYFTAYKNKQSNNPIPNQEQKILKLKNFVEENVVIFCRISYYMDNIDRLFIAHEVKLRYFDVDNSRS